MKQRFFVFPGGMTGAALFLLRLSVTISLTGPPFGRIPPQSLRALAFDLFAFAILVGVYTRVAAGLAALFAIFLVLCDPKFPVTAHVGFALPAIALAMIGPGAASLDSRLFGRRKISLPK